MSSVSDISSRIAAIRSTLPQGVELVAVSKFHPLESILEAAASGQRLFGESRVQELERKVASMAASESTEELRWHFIGHLQTNKVRQLLRLHPAMIESVDSLRLLHIIDREALAAGIVQPVLMQVHVAREETKFGFSPDELMEYFRARRFENLKATHICGLMGMASNTDDNDRVSADFRAIAHTHRAITGICPDLRGFGTISMGMSHDYPLAVAGGSNMVRVGTAIFGERQY